MIFIAELCRSAQLDGVAGRHGRLYRFSQRPEVSVPGRLCNGQLNLKATDFCVCHSQHFYLLLGSVWQGFGVVFVVVYFDLGHVESFKKKPHSLVSRGVCRFEP